jgi:hypothetical protein
LPARLREEREIKDDGAEDEKIYRLRRRLQDLAKATTPTKQSRQIMMAQLRLSSGTHAVRLATATSWSAVGEEAERRRKEDHALSELKHGRICESFCLHCQLTVLNIRARRVVAAERSQKDK